MLTMWVTEDEHRRLLERCDGKQLAAWMRQTCLDEKPARAGKLPSISPALLRQLAGMGNNLNQIARQVNAGGSSGLDRVQVVAALMAIDAGLERLRHAVLEKGLTMIVKFHPRGRGGGAGPVDYLLGKTASATVPAFFREAGGSPGAYRRLALRQKGTVAKLAMRQPFVLFKGLTFQKLCLPGAFRPGSP